MTQHSNVVQAASADEPNDIQRGRIGIQIHDSPDDNDGALIVSLLGEMTAEDAGLKVGDRVLKIGDRSCATHRDVIAAVAMSRAGDRVTMKIRRDNETLEQVIKLSSVGSEPRRVRFKVTPTRSQ